MRGKSHLNYSTTIFAFPFWMVIILIAEVAYSLDESLTSFKTVKFESLGQGIIHVLPTINATAVLNSINLVGSHLNKLSSAFFVECFMLLFKFSQLSLVQCKSMFKLHW